MPTPGSSPSPDPAELSGAILEPTGYVSSVHDPAMIKADDTYYLFSTGPGVSIRCSKDMLAWNTCGPVGRIFTAYPAWVLDAVPGVQDLWAPDIIFYSGKYYLYYSASTFGSNHSAIGLATNVTLDHRSPDYAWEDQGLVVASRPADNFNAIDPNLTFDAEGQPWLAFGSFWSGIQLVKVDPQTMKPAPQAELIHIASRPGNSAIEGAFIIHRDGYYYLFVSHDFCCQGIMSSYKIKVGRSHTIHGPYLDRDGQPLLEGGGSLVYSGSSRWRGPGHNSIFIEENTYWMVYHAYDADFDGTPTLRIEALRWDAEGWPSAPSAERDR